jgi:hypothetical protein
MKIRFLSLLILSLLVGCNAINPVWDTFKVATGIGENTGARLTPGVEYLKVQVNGRQVMMALGYRTFPKPRQPSMTKSDASIKSTQLYSKDEFVHEFWYSANKETLELVDGRIESVMGMTSEWRQSSSPPQDWESTRRNSPVFWTRTRDLMPGYRFGFKDEIQTRVTPAPAKIQDPTLPSNLDAVWFEDLVNSKDKNNSTWSYKQIFANVNGKIIYSEQCIASDLCLSLKYVGFIARE